MSRGLGHIQRAVIEALTAFSHSDVSQIGGVIYKTGPKHLNRLQILTVRQAVNSLAKRKLIKTTGEITKEGNPCWMIAVQIRKFPLAKRAVKKRRLSVVEPNAP